MNILLADDHSMVREGLKKILSHEFEPVSFGEAEDGKALLERVRSRKWDILILDITMPGLNFLDTLETIKKENPLIPVLVLSMHPADQFALKVLTAGASGYLNKTRAPQEVIAAVKKILSGGRYVSSTCAEKIVVDIARRGGGSALETLSQRELEVLQMIACGKKLTEIADIMALSVKTVSTYRKRILKKLSLKTNADLIEFVIKNQTMQNIS